MVDTISGPFQIIPYKDSYKDRREVLLQSYFESDYLQHSIFLQCPLGFVDPAQSLLVVDEKDQLLAHLTLMKRTITKGSETLFHLGIIGNVVSDPTVRRQGMIRMLFEDLCSRVKEFKLDGLVLWSELDGMYEKLGFTKAGKEVRFLIPFYDLDSSSELDSPVLELGLRFNLIHARLVDRLLYDEMMKMRPRVPCGIPRSYDDFKVLLSIPETYLITAIRGDDLVAFLIVGKGQDLIGVGHEWGYKNIKDFRRLIDWYLTVTHSQDVLVLAPDSQDKQVLQLREMEDVSTDSHFLCLARFENKSLETAVESGDLYIWGLDAI